MNKVPSKFIITCAPRTGSTMLRMMLNSHPYIICHGEVISIKGKPNLGKEYQKKIAKTSDELATIRSQDPVKFLDEYVLNQENCEAVGVKIKYLQLEEQFKSIFQRIANDKTIYIIHLTRKNLLKRYISNKLAGAKKTPTVIRDSTAKKEQPKIAINLQSCLEDILSVKEAEIRFREHFKNHKLFEIVYEDILADKNNQMNKLQNFLGVNSIDLELQTVKVNSDNLEEVVENYQELVTTIKDTPYAQYLD
ncbi:MAG: sulfotransferase [Xenococcaceae cyanobacterium MO_207.B15]|nr:sulfotransferase [Xenococcaceae cyanobacterium MO_207.B15]